MENNKSEFLKDPIEKKQIILKDIWSEILNKPDIGYTMISLWRGDFKGSCENGYKNERDF